MAPRTPVFVLPVLLILLILTTHIHPTTATNPNPDSSIPILHDSSLHRPHQVILPPHVVPYHNHNLAREPQYTLTLTVPLNAASSSISSTVTLTRPSIPHPTLPERIASGFTTVIGVNGTETATVDAAAVRAVETGKAVSAEEKEQWRLGRVEGEEDVGFGVVERGGAVGMRVGGGAGIVGIVGIVMVVVVGVILGL